MPVKLGDIRETGSAEKVHKQNNDLREKNRTLDERVRHAFDDFRETKVPPKKTPAGKDGPSEPRRTKGQATAPKHLPNAREAEQAKQIPRQAQVAQTSAENKKGVERGDKLPASHVYQQPSDPSAAARKNMPEAQQASRFVVETRGPNLAHLLKSTPPTPPKTEDGKEQAKRGQTEIANQAKETVGPKVQAPVTPDAGGRLADATKSEVGKKKEGEKKEGTERGEGKGALAATRSGSAGSGGRLEAASSGVASGSGEQVWIGDLEPLGYTVN
ncbi:MAG: hypothetical protein HY466_06320, partial [Deltaproteobacteria bacterium]|nr:hypothetical protein [Deltaproteobacteria bacterium]